MRNVPEAANMAEFSCDRECRKAAESIRVTDELIEGEEVNESEGRRISESANPIETGNFADESIEGEASKELEVTK
jgi:hypothetical protein